MQQQKLEECTNKLSTEIKPMELFSCERLLSIVPLADKQIFT